MNLTLKGGLHITSNEKISGRRRGYGARFRIDEVRGRSDGVGEMKAEIEAIYIQRKEWPRPAPERIDGEMERESDNRAFVMLHCVRLGCEGYIYIEKWEWRK